MYVLLILFILFVLYLIYLAISYLQIVICEEDFDLEDIVLKSHVHVGNYYLCNIQFPEAKADIVKRKLYLNKDVIELSKGTNQFKIRIVDDVSVYLVDIDQYDFEYTSDILEIKIKDLEETK